MLQLLKTRHALVMAVSLALLLVLGVALTISWQSALHDTEVITRKSPASATDLVIKTPDQASSASLSPESSSQPSADASPASTRGVVSPSGNGASSQATSEEFPIENPPLAPQPLIPAVYGAAQGTYTNAVMADGLSEIAQQFAEKVKQGGWDTTSAAYQSNWSNAAAEADALLRARYGVQTYMQLQHEAAAP
jgi:hypothetical protein